MKGLMFHGEEATRANTGAGAVLGPLVLQKCEVWRDVEVLREVCRSRLFAAEDGVGAVVVLRPEAVQDEARPRGAFWRSTPDGAELGLPGKVHEIEVEAAGLAFVLGVCGARGRKSGKEQGG